MRALVAALLSAVAMPAAAAAAEPVTVTLRPRICSVSTSTVAAGPVTFLIRNRSGAVGSFAIAGRRRSEIGPGRMESLTVALGAGRHAYRCTPRGSGFLTASAPEHRIGVRVVNGVGELFDRTNGQRFVPRGSNYIRLGPNRLPSGEPIVAHTTFNVGVYDGARAGTALARMRADGFNAVRVFLGTECADGCAIDAATARVSTAYVRNLADFLRRANASRIVVVVTIGFLTQGRYAQLIDAGASPQVRDINLNYLTTGGVRGNAEFWRDLVAELVRQGAPVDAVLAYDLRNEINFVRNNPPFTLSTGSFTAANGSTYDLSRPEEHARLIDESLVFYIERVREAIRSADPTALVDASFFHPQEPNPARIGDIRIIRTRAVIERSAADFVDLHPYPGIELSLPQYMQNFGVGGATAKPIVMGEYGAFHFAYATAGEAAGALQAWESESCPFGFDGWLLWTWDSDEQPELWNALDEGGTIERALAPVHRPDPCAPPTAPRNVALGKPTTASHSAPGSPPSLAVDGLKGTAWRSEESPPQWIEIDLHAPVSLSRIGLYVDQFPAGFTVHSVWGRGPGENAPERLLHEFAGVTSEGQALEYAPPNPWPNVRFLRVETVSGPSWVAWKEIEAIASG